MYFVIVMMRLKKVASKGPKWRICIPSIILTLNILSSRVIVSGNLLPNTVNNQDNDEFNFQTTTKSVILTTKYVDRDSEGLFTESQKNIGNVSGVHNILELGNRPAESVSRKLVDKVSKDDMKKVTDSDSPVKGSLESVKGENVNVGSSKMTFATELYNTVDGVVTVNQSIVSESVIKSKTETETYSSGGTSSSRGEEESSTLLVLRLAQCRANCLAKKSEKLKKRQKYSVYFKKLDVFASTLKEQIKLSYTECWNTCLLLEIENGENHPAKLDAVCSLNNNTCLSGCQEACEFHDVQHVAKNGTKKTKAPLLAAKVESFLSYNLSTPSMKKRSGFQLDLRWPESEGFLVYSVVQHVRMSVKNVRLGWTWRLLEQTTMGKISLHFSEKPKIGDIRVLAANSLNLVRVFSQEKIETTRQTPMEQVHLVKSQNNDHQNQEQDQEQHQHQGSDDLWHLRKVSMVHQKFLVVTEITWDLPQNKSQVPASTSSSSSSSSSSSPSTSQSQSVTSHMNSTSITKQGNDTQMKEASNIQQTVSVPSTSSSSSPPLNQIKCNFLLTWEVSGGILRGNMVTDTNTVTISLWPDTIYSIQVGLIDDDSNGKDGKKLLKPWEFEGEPKVTVKSSLLSVNTSEAVYGEKGESDINKSELKSVQSVTSRNDQPQHQHQHRQSESLELISSFAQIQHESDVGDDRDGDGDDEEEEEDDEREDRESVNDNDGHIRNSTSSSSITAWKCELPSGMSKWLCQLSMSWLVILGSIYGLLFILSMTVYLFFAFKNYPYPSPRRLSNYLRRSTCKLALLQDDFQQHQAEDDSNSTLPHFDDDRDRMRKELDTLSQYNIV